MKKLYNTIGWLFRRYPILLGLLVFQNADTLKFIDNNQTVEHWLIGEGIKENTDNNIKITRKVKISKNHKFFILYEEKNYVKDDSIVTKLILYTADKKKLWQRQSAPGRRIAFDLTNIYEDIVVLVTVDNSYALPKMELIKKENISKLISTGDWQRLVSYSFSPNRRYLGMHVRNPYNNRLWDYIYFIDLKEKNSWTYLFPTCLSCKRYRITLKIDDQGKTEVVYKGQHRIFSKDGKLLDFFIKL